jgi:hypothetical protein
VITLSDAPSTPSGQVPSTRAARSGQVYRYHEPVLEALGKHGLKPLPHSTPQQLRDAVRDLYKYEIRRLRDTLLAGRIVKRDYAGHVIELRKRYWLLSVPLQLWTVDGPPGENATETPRPM